MQDSANVLRSDGLAATAGKLSDSSHPPSERSTLTFRAVREIGQPCSLGARQIERIADRIPAGDGAVRAGIHEGVVDDGQFVVGDVLWL